MRKKIISVFLILVIMLSNSTIVFADISHLDENLLRNLGVEIEIGMGINNYGFERLDIQNEDRKTSLPQLRRISPYEPLNISSQIDIRVMLDAMEWIFYATDDCIVIDGDILSAIREIDLMDYWLDGIRRLIKNELDYHDEVETDNSEELYITPFFRFPDFEDNLNLTLMRSNQIRAVTGPFHNPQRRPILIEYVFATRLESAPPGSPTWLDVGMLDRGSFHLHGSTTTHTFWTMWHSGIVPRDHLREAGASFAVMNWGVGQLWVFGVAMTVFI
ncbi:MAG: hypothetical protein FWF81_02035 [Defluviitaleaceae bacterium]|nr:hypothetical protein [Defluviitaleaceae bacterium]